MAIALATNVHVDLILMDTDLPVLTVMPQRVASVNIPPRIKSRL